MKLGTTTDLDPILINSIFQKTEEILEMTTKILAGIPTGTKIRHITPKYQVKLWDIEEKDSTEEDLGMSSEEELIEMAETDHDKEYDHLWDEVG